MLRQRTHSNRCSSTPAASALRGSNESRASINAHTSASAVLEAKAESSTVVRPEHGGPQISVNAPRGKPPARASISGIPVSTVSTLLRSRYPNGETTRPGRESSTSERRVARLERIENVQDPKTMFAFCSPCVFCTIPAPLSSLLLFMCCQFRSRVDLDYFRGRRYAQSIPE